MIPGRTDVFLFSRIRKPFFLWELGVLPLVVNCMGHTADLSLATGTQIKSVCGVTPPVLHTSSWHVV